MALKRRLGHQEVVSNQGPRHNSLRHRECRSAEEGNHFESVSFLNSQSATITKSRHTSLPDELPALAKIRIRVSEGFEAG
jgi:hypothetical protein